MHANTSYFLVEGERGEQTRVRPHNWAERFASNLASYGADRRLHYSDEITPVMVNGVKCLRVAHTLEQTHPTLLQDILAFANLHALHVHGFFPPEERLPLAS